MDEKNTEAPPRPVAMGGAQAGRMTGKAVLRDVARRMRRQADNIEAIADMLPEKLTIEQDEALWEVAISLPRK